MTGKTSFVIGAIALAFAGSAAAHQQPIKAARCIEGTCTHTVKVKRVGDKCLFDFAPEVLLVRKKAEFIEWKLEGSGDFVFEKKAIQWKVGQNKGTTQEVVNAQFPKGEGAGTKVWKERIQYQDPGLAFYYKFTVRQGTFTCSFDPPIVNDMGNCSGDPPPSGC